MSTIATTRRTTSAVPMTYARARLWLGITCVGTHVLVALFAVLTNMPALMLPGADASLINEILSVACFFFCMAALMLPFDVVGGMVLPRRFQGSDRSTVSFVTKLVQGVAVQATVFTAVLTLYGLIGSKFGATSVVIAFICVQLILVACQLRMAEWVGSMQRHRLRATSARAVALTADDAGFTGGVAGLPGSDSVVLPTAWIHSLPSRLQDVALLRRQLSIESGRRLVGVVLGIAWNTMALVAALALPNAGVESVASLITTYFYFTLFGFVGLLFLPALNRRAVLAVDQLAKTAATPDEIAKLAAAVDDLAEGEPSRSRRLESVFHPIPCVELRTASLASRSHLSGGLAWHVARMALFCAWAFGGPLSRSVHCNIGRPELWVFLPAD